MNVGEVDGRAGASAKADIDAFAADEVDDDGAAADETDDDANGGRGVGHFSDTRKKNNRGISKGINE